MAEKDQRINDTLSDDGGGIPRGVAIDSAVIASADTTTEVGASGETDPGTSDDPSTGTAPTSALDGEGVDPNDLDTASLVGDGRDRSYNSGTQPGSVRKPRQRSPRMRLIHSAIAARQLPPSSLLSGWQIP